MSTLNLVKGQKLDLTKGNPGLSKVNFGLGWDINSSGGSAFDLDVFAILLGSNGKVVGPAIKDSVVYFGNLELSGIKHAGDNLTGAGDGDDETLSFNLSSIPPTVESVIIGVNIYEAASRRQLFGQVQNAFIRGYNAETNAEMFKFDLTEDHSNVTGLIAARVYRHSGEWKFEAIDKPVNGDINQILQEQGYSQ